MKNTKSNKDRKNSRFSFSKKSWRYLILMLILGLAVHVLLPQITTLEKSVKVIKEMRWWALGLAVISQVISYFGSGYLIKAIVGVFKQKISPVLGTIITLSSSSIGLVAGGMVGSGTATYRWLRSRNIKAQAAGLAGTLPSLFNNILLVLVSIFGLVHLLIVHQLSTPQIVTFIVILVVLMSLVTLIYWGMKHRTSLTDWVVRLGSRWAGFRKREFEQQNIESSLDDLFEAWDLMLAGAWRGPVMGAGINTLFDMLTLYFLFIAAGHAVSPGVLLAGYGLPLLLGKAAFVLPGGVGIVESTMAALYDGLGVPDSVTVIVVLIYRILSFWLPTILGFPLIAYLQRSKKPADEGIRNDNLEHLAE